MSGAGLEDRRNRKNESVGGGGGRENRRKNGKKATNEWFGNSRMERTPGRRKRKA